MSWTKSGTVSLTNNSATVYGAGTTWVSGGKTRAGDVYIAPNGDLLEVASIQSNTQLTLATAYLGTTASAQAYALLHIGLLPAELAVSLSDLQSKYLTTISQLYDWETSAAATVNLTNPATGVTAAVKTISQMIADLAAKAPLASPNFTGTVGGITKSMVGLGNVDNTSDASKPVSTTQQTALNLKANLASPNFTGTVSFGAGTNKTLIKDDNTLVLNSSGAEGGQSQFNKADGTLAYTHDVDAGSTPSMRIFNASAVGVTLAWGATAFSAMSDIRSKDILEPISNAVAKVCTLRAVIGKYKTDEGGTRRSFLIAQDVQAVLPEAVSVGSDEEGTLNLRYSEVVPLLVAAIKEQQQIISEMSERITLLEAA